MVELWLVVEPQVNNNTLYWAHSASFSVEELNEIGETESESDDFKRSV